MNKNLTLVLDPVSVYSTVHKFIAKNVLKVFVVRNQLRTEDEMKGNARYNGETVMKCLLLFEFDED